MSDFEDAFKKAPKAAEFEAAFNAAPHAPVRVEPLKEFDRGALARDTPTIPKEPTLFDMLSKKLGSVSDPSSYAGAAARGAGQGVTFGWGDELNGVGGAMQELEGRHPVAGRIVNGVAQAAFPPLALPKAGVDASSIDPAHPLTQATDEQKQRFADEPSTTRAMLMRYLADRNDQRSENKQAKASHPYVEGAAGVAGAMAIPVPGMGAIRTVPEFLKAMPVGGVVGALSGAGNAEGDAKDQALTTAAGGLGGALATPILGSLATKAGDAIASGAKGLRNWAALKAFLQSGITDRLKKQGMSPEEGRALAGRLYDRGAIPFFSGPEGIEKNLAQAKILPGEQIETALQDLTSTGVPFDFNQAAAKMSRAGAESENLAPGMSVSALKLANNKKAEALADIVRKQGDITEHSGNLGWLDANSLKSDAWKGANFSQDVKAEPEAYRRAVAALRDQIEQQGEEAWVASGKGLDPQFKGLPSPAESLRSANDVYGDLSRAQDLVSEKATRNAAHKLIPISTAIMGGLAGHQAGGGSLGTLAAGIGLPLLSHAATAYGPSMAAGTFQGVSKLAGNPAAQYVMGQGAKFAALQGWLDSDKKPEALTDLPPDSSALPLEQKEKQQADEFARSMRGGAPR